MRRELKLNLGIEMNRRQFIKYSILGSISVVGVSGGAFGLIEGVDKSQLTIEKALARLEDFSGGDLVHSGVWTPDQIFTHCAQSIEYSMSGFPVHKSDWFKQTIGSLAFTLFSAKGKMRHGLSEPIPGAPILASRIEHQVALLRLKKALMDFKDYQGRLAPHFAYGKLSKTEYELAHVMHLNNHLQEINI